MLFPPALVKELVYSSGIPFIIVMQTAVRCIYLDSIKHCSELDLVNLFKYIVQDDYSRELARRVVLRLTGRSLKTFKFTVTGSANSPPGTVT